MTDATNEQSDLDRAMDLLTMGYRTKEEVSEILGDAITQAALRQLDDDYGYDHYPWYAKQWKPLDDFAEKRVAKRKQEQEERRRQRQAEFKKRKPIRWWNKVKSFLGCREIL